MKRNLKIVILILILLIAIFVIIYKSNLISTKNDVNAPTSSDSEVGINPNSEDEIYENTKKANQEAKNSNQNEISEEEKKELEENLIQTEMELEQLVKNQNNNNSLNS